MNGINNQVFFKSRIFIPASKANDGAKDYLKQMSINEINSARPTKSHKFDDGSYGIANGPDLYMANIIENMEEKRYVAPGAFKNFYMSGGIL